MSNHSVQTVSTSSDKYKIILAIVAVVAGVAAFYILAKQPTYVRIAALGAGLVVAIVLAWTSDAGRDFFAFAKESVRETKKVVWPTRKETIQTTVAVFLLVLVMAAFLAVVDIGFAYMVQWLMGRSA